MRGNDKMLKGLETCEVLVISVLAFGMDYINNLKTKDLSVLLLLLLSNGDKLDYL